MLETTKPGIDIGILTANEADQRRFYGERLGLPHLGEFSLPNGRMHIYACGDTLLKLYVTPDAQPAAASPFQRVGIAYLTISVADVRAEAARLQAQGVQVDPVGEFDSGVTLDAPVGRVRALYARTRDADGNVVELLPRL